MAGLKKYQAELFCYSGITDGPWALWSPGAEPDALLALSRFAGMRLDKMAVGKVADAKRALRAAASSIGMRVSFSGKPGRPTVFLWWAGPTRDMLMEEATKQCRAVLATLPELDRQQILLGLLEDEVLRARSE